MAYKITWLPKAEKRYDEIIAWLENNWSGKEIANFISRTDEVLKLISVHPETYKLSEKKNIRQALVTKQNLLLYEKNQIV